MTLHTKKSCIFQGQQIYNTLKTNQIKCRNYCCLLQKGTLNRAVLFFFQEIFHRKINGSNNR